MKRSAALIPLSREHHQALVTAKRLLDMAQQQPQSLPAYWQSLRSRFAPELLEHLAEEEQHFGDLLSGALQQQFIDEHRQLRALLDSDDIGEIQQFAKLLRAHVRFEERELFGWLEQHHGEVLHDRAG